MEKAETNEKQPFFARFLENQKVRTGIRSGKVIAITYPCVDNDQPWY